jgi:hypothetical protein
VKPPRTITQRLRRFDYVPRAALAIGGVATLLQVTAMAFAASGGLVDFHTFYRAGADVLAGSSPYPPNDLHALAKQDVFVYPAPAALLFAPFALLPPLLADIVWYAGSVAAGLGALWLAGARDRRIHLAALCSMWLVHGWFVGTVTPLLALGLALAWRWRDTAWRAPAVIAVMIGVKLFPAPLVVWLWATGRRWAAIRAAALSGVLIAGAWAAIGFDGISSYASTLGTLSRLLADDGVSMTALLQAVGLGFDLAKLLAIGLAAGLLVASLWAGRRDERLALLLCVVAALTASPIVWTNYMTLLMVVVAMYEPVLAWVWVAPMALWLVPDMNVQGSAMRPIAWNAMLAVVVVGCLLRQRRRAVMLPSTAQAPPVAASPRTPSLAA